MAPRGSSETRGGRGRGGSRRGGGGDGGRPGSTGCQQPSPTQQETPLQQLRDLLYPRVTTRDLLRRYLIAARWDVERAATSWTRDRERILAGNGLDSDCHSDSSLSSLSSSSSSSSNDRPNSPGDGRCEEIDLRVELETAGLHFNDSVEQERRDAAHALRIRIEEIHEVVLSRSEAVLLLSSADWDLGAALASFTSHEEARSRLRIAFDGMRADTDDVDQQSARIAGLLDITERADWLSMKIFLQKVNWDFVQAVIQWHKSGIMPFKSDNVPSTQSRNKAHWACRIDTDGRLREMPTDKDCTAATEENPGAWADDTDDFTNPNDKPPATPIIPGTDDDVTQRLRRRNRPPRFVIHAINHKALEPGPKDTSKWLFEYILRGVYHANLFKNEKYRFPDRVADVEDTKIDNAETDSSHSSSNSDKSSSSGPSPKRQKKGVVEFHFGSSKHVKDLNNWRRQNWFRLCGVSWRPAAQTWVQAELDFLYPLTQEWFNELKQQNPTTKRQDILEKNVIRLATKRDWIRRFNERFTDTTPAGATEPRRDRNLAAIMTHRGRYARLAIHFRVNPDKKWLAKVDPEERERLEAERRAFERADLILTIAEVQKRAAAEAASLARDLDENEGEDKDEDAEEENEDA